MAPESKPTVWRYYRSPARDCSVLSGKSRAVEESELSGPRVEFSRLQSRSIGLPILRNKLFAFGDFELVRLTQSAPTRNTLPTAAERAGCFRGPDYDPKTLSGGMRTSFPVVTAASATALWPVGSYQVPQSRIDTIAAQLVQACPVPATGGALN